MAQLHPTLLYVPDTAPWRTWSPSLTEVIERERVDVLLVDGTFYSADELPGRDVASIGHPLMTDTFELLAPLALDSRRDSVAIGRAASVACPGLVAAGRLRVLFTHLNHSNPALDPSSEGSRTIQHRGFEIAIEGEEIGL